MLKTSAASWASTAAWYPDPVPISSTRSPGLSSNHWVIQATTYGCDTVCPRPRGSATSAYASPAHSGGTNSCRGTASIARRTRGFVMSGCRSSNSAINRGQEAKGAPMEQPSHPASAAASLSRPYPGNPGLSGPLTFLASSSS